MLRAEEIGIFLDWRQKNHNETGNVWKTRQLKSREQHLYRNGQAHKEHQYTTTKLN